MGCIRRLPCLRVLTVPDPSMVWPACTAIARGYCRQVTHVALSIDMYAEETIPPEMVTKFAAALATGALPALRALSLPSCMVSGGQPPVLEALASGASPRLRKLALDIPQGRTSGAGGAG